MEFFHICKTPHFAYIRYFWVILAVGHVVLYVVHKSLVNPVEANQTRYAEQVSNIPYLIEQE